VPLYDGDENIGLAPYTDNLDTWDGMRWCHQALGCHLGVGRLDDGRHYACYSSDWPEGIVRCKGEDGIWEVFFRCSDDFGPPALAVVITEEEARELVRKYNKQKHEEMFGEQL